MALANHCASSAAYTPCSRHQAFLAVSFIDAVVITASSRVAAVWARPRAGPHSNSACQRSSVPALTPTCSATHSTAALYGASNRATALLLNDCPYLATVFPFRCPLGSKFKEVTTIVTRGG